MIMDNNGKDDNICLIYKETVDGVTAYCKIYNKMVQMLESECENWYHWVCQKSTRFANACDVPTDRGQTGVEATFIDSVSNDVVVEGTLEHITRNVPASLVYSTPYAGTWNAYCDALSHSLFVIDGTRNVAMIVYTYNEMTKSINRQTVTDWTLFQKFMFTNMTFSSKLPMDIIDVCDCSKARRGKVKDTYIDISGARYFKS